MTRTRQVGTVAAFACSFAAGWQLLHTLETVGWPAVTALLRAYGWSS